MIGQGNLFTGLNYLDELSMSFCGTPEYLAPEMVNHAGHDKSVDWWALGVLIYEMLIGVTPFYNRNRNMLLMKIKNSKVIFPDKTKYKIEYSDEIVDLILKVSNIKVNNISNSY
jgi:serum/glucocorticoid-regulated kinase 2